jgi:PAP2 superfamily
MYALHGRTASIRSRAPAAPALVLLAALSFLPARADATDDPAPPAAENSSTAENAPAADDPSTADNLSATDKPYWRTNLFGRFFGDQKYLFTTWWPSEFKRPAFSVPLLAGTALAISSSHEGGEGPDVQLERRFSEWSDDRNTTSAHLFTSLGNGATGAVLLGTAWLVGRFSGHDTLSEASSLSAEVLLDVGLYSVILKEISARTRPSGGATGDFLEFHPDAGESPDSFPSGHAMGAFAVATVFSGVYREHRWVPWVAYGAAGLVGASRVALGRHFPSDVIVGGILGNSLGRMVVTRQEGTETPVARFVPIGDPVTRRVGLAWTYSW